MESGSGRWMLTYLDMITLLFGVFIIMYAMSSVNKAKIQEVSQSLKMGFQGGATIFINNKQGGQTLRDDLKPEGSKKEILFNKLIVVLKEEIKNKNINIREEEGGITITLAGDLYFAPGSAELNPGAQGILDKVASIVKDVPFYIRAEGHTDEMPVDENVNLDNWQLAALRAANVVRFLQYVGVEPRKMSAVSFGEYKPKTYNRGNQTTPEKRSEERRVDIIIPTDKEYVYMSVTEDVPTGTTETIDTTSNGQ
jgi:chemotaxis protein MotB